MREASKSGGFVWATLYVVVILAGLGVPTASSQDTRGTTATAKQRPMVSATQPDAHHARPLYYVDFRARTAASYGHAFVWYGRTDQRAVEVAGLHPASESVIPYILGHVIPVPSETGASYGDLDEQYLQAHYKVLMTEAEARPVFAY